MEVMDKKSEQLYQNLRDQYILYLNNQGIQTPIDYLNKIGEISNSTHSKKQLQEMVKRNNIDLTAFYRVSPSLNQDVVIASPNPGTTDQNNGDGMTSELFAEGGKYYKFNEKDTIAGTARVTAKHTGNFLEKDKAKGGFAKIIKNLQDKFNTLPGTDEISYEDYINTSNNVDFGENFFVDIHYTRVLKFPSNDTTSIQIDGLWEMAKLTYIQELFHLMNPKLVVCSGKEAWIPIYDTIEEQGWKDEVDRYNNSNYVRKYGPHKDGQARSGLFYLPQMDLWIMTTRQGSHGVLEKRLEENLRTLSNETQL